MKKNILILNQALNKNILNLYTDIFRNSLKADLLSGVYENGQIRGLNLVKAPSFEADNYFSRIKSWFKYINFVHKWNRVNLKDYDIIFVYTNPPIAPLYVLLLSIMKRKPFMIMIWDIYPDVLKKSISFLFLKPLYFIWDYLNEKTYKKALCVLTIGKNMADTIRNNLREENINIQVLTNWSDSDRIKPIKKNDNRFIKENRFDDRFIVMYSGKMGLGHEIKTILRASEIIPDDNVIFIFIGFGPGQYIVEKHIKTSKMKNVFYFPYQEEEMFKHSIASADIGIVSQIKGMEKLFMPCKVYDMMSAGAAIIGISNGENDLKQTILKAKCGINIESGDYVKLKEEILKLKSDKQILNGYKENARKFIEYECNKNIMAEKYKRIINRVLNEL